MFLLRICFTKHNFFVGRKHLLSNSETNDRRTVDDVFLLLAQYQYFTYTKI